MSGKKDFSKFVGLASEQADRDMVYRDLQRRGKDTNNRKFVEDTKVKEVNPGKIKQLKLFRFGGATADPFGDKRRQESARTMANLKKVVMSDMKTKPVKISIQSASITTPRGMSIEKNTIMPKMMSKGGVVDMTRSIQINPETGE